VCVRENGGREVYDAEGNEGERGKSNLKRVM
jgi:hypothetical protein